MIKGMTLPKGGSRLPLILGLVLGLAAAVLVVVVLTGSEEKGGNASVRSGEGVPVVVAARDLPAGTKLTAGDLTTVGFADGRVPTGAFGTIDDAVVGKVTRVAVVMNDPVLSGKLGGQIIAEGEDLPLAYVIDDGQRAVAVGVSSLIGAGGNIRPGDFVDVVLIVELKAETANPEQSGTSDQIGATILQNVKVLAIDQTVTNPNSETTANPNEGKKADEGATTLTVQVTPTQGEVLSMAEVCGSNHGGRISVSLRSPGDNAPLSNRPTWDNNGPPPKCSEVLGIAALGQ
ncbi:MAG TPA: Flp pilus assembly protein CpaB [Lysobacter sp.]|jgi:pilus assembly protein CpaB|nr:Flp pilus assembly protein CpaB [Lysobacter sp.]